MKKKTDLDHVKDLQELLQYANAVGKEMFQDADDYQDAYRLMGAISDARRKLAKLRKEMENKGETTK